MYFDFLMNFSLRKVNNLIKNTLFVQISSIWIKKINKRCNQLAKE